MDRGQEQTTNSTKRFTANGPGTGQHGLVLQALLPAETGAFLPRTHRMSFAASGVTAPPASVNMAQIGVVVERLDRKRKPARQGAIIGIEEGDQWRAAGLNPEVAGRRYSIAAAIKQAPTLLGPVGTELLQ